MSGSGSIFISAGDPSADFPGKNLIDEIKRACPEIEIPGLGGPLMQEAGLQPLADHKKLAVLGFWEVIPRCFFFRRLLEQSVNLIKEKRPKAVILIDYPGFNLRLAARVKPLGIPIIYYISPQIWAWGGKRIRTIRELVDLMLVIFPFEEKFYKKRGIAARFTGHPIMDRFESVPDKKTCREKVAPGMDGKIITLLPGSRIQEVKRMLPVMADSTEIIRQKINNVRFIVAAVESIGTEIYAKIIGGREITIVSGKTPEAICASDLVITSSGTATIEAAYFTRPMIVIYKTGFLTYRIARRLIKLDSIGMVNIVAGRNIVPELIQRKATASSIASHAVEILQNQSRYDKIIRELQQVRDKLGSGNAGRRAFDAVQELVPLC